MSVIGLQPKECPAGIWTVGYGHALRNNRGEYLRGNKDKAEAYRQFPGLTELEANNLLEQDLKLFGSQVSKLIKLPVTDNQFGACVSLAYNIGVNAFADSTVCKCINDGHFALAANAFSLWNKGTINGVRMVLNGLTKRRESEKELFLSA
jgi:lysozyme